VPRGDPVYELVRSRPIPERMIESLAIAPLLPPHELEVWVRAGGRITNRFPREIRDKRFHGPRLHPPPDRLSKRELEAIRLLAAGRTAKEAAFELGVTRGSFGGLLTTARYRLGRSPTSERAVLVAAARGLVELPEAPPAIDRLTARERQALALFHAGGTKKEIAAALEVAPDTAGSLLKACRRKLGTSSTAVAARIAFEAA